MSKNLKFAGIGAGLCLALAALSASIVAADPQAPSVSAPPAAQVAPPTGKMPPAPITAPKKIATPTTSPYPDVPAKHPAAAAVQSLKDKKVMASKADGKFHGSDSVTRYELAVILDRFITYNETAHKPIKQTRIPGPYLVSAPASHWAHESQVRIEEDGFLPKTSPILQKPGDAKVTHAELTTALSQVMIRLSDRELPVTHPDAPSQPIH